jgi:hypothetical protein
VVCPDLPVGPADRLTARKLINADADLSLCQTSPHGKRTNVPHCRTVGLRNFPAGDRPGQDLSPYVTVGRRINLALIVMRHVRELILPVPDQMKFEYLIMPDGPAIPGGARIWTSN